MIRADTLEQLIDVGVLLERQAAPAGLRVAVIGNAHGPMILCADAAEANGLDLPALSLQLRHQIAELVPDAASTGNPVDVGTGVTADGLAAVVRATGGSGEVDACLVMWVEGDDSYRARPATFSGIPLGGVPVAVTMIGGHDNETGLLPSFPSPERAAVAMARAAGRAGWLATLARDSTDETMVLDVSAFVDARRLARGHAGVVSEITWLSTVDSFELLTSAGLPVAPSHYARSADECAVAADRLGYPSVVKADTTDVRHKSEAGVVVVGVGDPATARATYEDFAQRFRNRIRGVVIQAQHPSAFELLVGITRDPTFGPHVVVGAGGVEAELRGDDVLLVAPVSRSAARRAVESLRLAPLFHRFHGRSEIPVEPVVELVHRLGMLAAAVPEIRRLELNPVLVSQDGCVAVDASIGVGASTFVAGPMRGLRVRRRTDE